MTEQIMTDRERTALQLSRAREALEKVWPMIEEEDFMTETTESRHTPGPWAVHERFYKVIVPLDHKYRPLGASADEEVDGERYALPIAESLLDSLSGFAHERTAEEAAANARLIAAAPDLLKACKMLLGIVRLQNGNLHDDINAIQAEALAAIEKATGEKP